MPAAISKEKIQQSLVAALVGTPFSTGQGTPAGTCTGAIATKEGVCLYIQLNSDITRLDDSGKTKTAGFSFTIPLYHFLPEGEVAVCPSESGTYEITLTNGANIRLDYRVDVLKGTANWMLGERIVGNFHEVRLPDWSTPAIVTGMKLIALASTAGQPTIVEESVEMPQAAVS